MIPTRTKTGRKRSRKQIAKSVERFGRVRKYVEWQKTNPPNWPREALQDKRKMQSYRRWEIAMRSAKTKKQLEAAARQAGWNINTSESMPARAHEAVFAPEERGHFLFDIMNLHFNPKQQRFEVNPKAVPFLEMALRDSNRKIRHIALLGLTFAASTKSVTKITRLLHDPHHLIREAAVEALVLLNGKKAIPDIEFRMEHEKADWVNCAHALIYFGSKKSFPKIRAKIRQELAQIEGSVGIKNTRYGPLIEQMHRAEKGKSMIEYRKSYRRGAVSRLLNVRYYG